MNERLEHIEMIPIIIRKLEALIDAQPPKMEAISSPDRIAVYRQIAVEYSDLEFAAASAKRHARKLRQAETDAMLDTAGGYARLTIQGVYTPDGVPVLIYDDDPGTPSHLLRKHYRPGDCLSWDEDARGRDDWSMTAREIVATAVHRAGPVEMINLFLNEGE